MGNNKEIQRQQYNRTVAMLKQYRDAQFFLQHTTDEESKQRTEAAVQHITAALEEIQRRRQQAEREEEYTALEKTLQHKPNYFMDTTKFIKRLATYVAVEHTAFIIPIEDEYRKN